MKVIDKSNREMLLEFLELPAIPLKTLQKNIKTFSKKDGFDDESYTFYE